MTVGDTSGMVEAEKNAHGSGRWRPPGPGSSACAALSTGASALLPPGLSLPQRPLLGPGLRSAPPIRADAGPGTRGAAAALSGAWRSLVPTPGRGGRETAFLLHGGVSSASAPHPLFFQFLADIYNLESHKNEYR